MNDKHGYCKGECDVDRHTMYVSKSIGPGMQEVIAFDDARRRADVELSNRHNFKSPLHLTGASS